MTEQERAERLTIRQALGNDPKACELLVKKYNTYAFSIAIRIIKNREDAEEAVQDSFVKALRSLKNYKGTGKFSTWLYAIVYNTCLSRIRNKRIILDTLEEFPDRELDFDVSDNYPGAFERLVQSDQIEILKTALLALSDSENLVITLYYTCENTIAEVASITGWKASTIKIRLYRARQKLYTELSRLLKKELNELL